MHRIPAWHCDNLRTKQTKSGPLKNMGQYNDTDE